MVKTIVFFLFFLNCINALSQIHVVQDVFKGGVTGDAFNPWNLPIPGNFEIYIEPGSNIRQAYLFGTVIYEPDDLMIFINNMSVLLSKQNSFDNDYYLHNSAIERRMRTFMINVTHLINPTQSSYTISALNQSPTLSPGIFCEFYLYVAYENPIMQEICSNVFINNVQPNEIMTYNFIELNPIDLSQNVGLAINSSNICDTLQDGSYVKVNNSVIGLIGGEENPGVECSGVSGSFYYQNNQLFGLDNDISNTTMYASDGIANIESYLDQTTEFDLVFEYQSNLGPQTNTIHQLFLTYTTPCTEFPTQTSTDTTLCQGTTAQLFASGGQAYSWQPATGLSCTDCPNPIVTADSSRLYTVRIWNNDSCSVVRPIKVNVQPLPQFSGVGSTPTACGQNTGSAIVVAQNTTPLPLSYSINGAPFAFSSTYTGNFTNLSAGANTIILRDAFGCETDTVIEIGVTNTTNAFFTATPNSGAAPLTVSFTNQSTNATNYSWFIESDFLGDNLLQHTFDTSGNYTVTLIAWQNDPLCADTFSIQIVVYDSLIIQIPNVFTPNGDGINDQFTITTNQPVSVEYHLFNRWGNVIAQDTKPTTAGNSNFVLPIWDGENYSDGTYFYVIRVVHDGKEYEFDGFLERVE